MNIVNIILDEFHNAGYKIESPIILNSLNFGVPKKENVYFL